MFTDLLNSVSEAVERGEMTEAQAVGWRTEAAAYENGTPVLREAGSVVRREPVRLFYEWLHTFRGMEPSEAREVAKLGTPRAQALWREFIA